MDINQDEFYQKLETSPVHPTTSQPPPSDFADIYRKLSREADAIVSIHVTGKLSGTYHSALQGKAMANTGCPIEVVDSGSVSMGLGLVAMAAARLARVGEHLPQIMDEVRRWRDYLRGICEEFSLNLANIENRIDKFLQDPDRVLMFVK